MSTLYLCAAGNPEGVRLALAVNRAAERWDRVVLLDDDPAKLGRDILGVEVMGPFEQLREHRPGDEAVNLVARSTQGRARAREKILSYGIPITSLVHPSVDTFGVTLGKEITIYPQCTLSALSSVGDQAVVFGQAVLGHGATLGAGAVLAPGAVVNARVRVGDRAYVGANASVLPDLEVAPDATVGACSAVVSDVPAGSTALGVPAETIPGGGSTPTPTTAPAPAAASVDGAAEVRRVFERVLQKPSLGLDDNFFDVGGTSRLALVLGRELARALGISVSPVDVFRFPTIRRLAAHLRPASTPGSALDAASTRAEKRKRRRATA
jgi:carbonic anhydrase/acetyltransferase-like protein (isoleucine patch superfamily)